MARRLTDNHALRRNVFCVKPIQFALQRDKRQLYLCWRTFHTQLNMSPDLMISHAGQTKYFN